MYMCEFSQKNSSHKGFMVTIKYENLLNRDAVYTFMDYSFNPSISCPFMPTHIPQGQLYLVYFPLKLGLDLWWPFSVTAKA